MKFITAAEQKAALRAQIRSRLSALSGPERRRSDEALFSSFLALPQVEQARTLLLFAGMGTEPDTLHLVPALLSRGKTVALPRCLPGRGMEARLWDGRSPLIRHPYGMEEPGQDCPVIQRDSLDLILVPALCYDRRGFRLGHGGGFYDRWLPGFPGVSVGLCRDVLLQSALPAEEHDLPVDLVVTETAKYETRPPEGGPVPAGNACNG